MINILLVDKDMQEAHYLRSVFPDGSEVHHVEDPSLIPDSLKIHKPHAVFIDLPSYSSWREILLFLSTIRPKPPILMYSYTQDAELVAEAMHAGVSDILPKPLPRDRISATIGKLCTPFCESINKDLQKADKDEPQLWGHSALMRSLRVEAIKMASWTEPVLILGETGSGKDVLANFIHSHSPYANGKFTALNCASIPESLFESEIFGSAKGAFTEARDRKGFIEVSEGGSLFLDEIGELSYPLQAKLLRFLETGSFQKLGNSEEKKVDCRIIAATNRDLSEMVKMHRFRDDLFYRIGILIIRMPPLREHPEDIPLYVDRFIQEMLVKNPFAKSNRFSNQAMNHLLSLSWPGNVRQLRSVVLRSMCAANGDTVELHHLRVENG